MLLAEGGVAVCGRGVCNRGVPLYYLNYSGILIKSIPRDRKKLLTVRKIDFIQFQGRKPKYYQKIGVALGASPLLLDITGNNRNPLVC